ncbi:MAG: hypothetical protein ACFE95_12335 [Candidatus Hodarchaeota archaeon]
MEFGVSNTVGGDRVIIKEENIDYRQKILFGPKITKTSFIPVWTEGEARKIAIPTSNDRNDGSLIWKFVGFDTGLARKDFREKHGIKQGEVIPSELKEDYNQVKSALTPNSQYLYLGFDLLTDKLLGTKVRILQHKYTVYEFIGKIQSEPFKTAEGIDKNKMHYCPIVLVILSITRTMRDPTKSNLPKYKNTQYVVTPLLPTNKLQGLFDIGYGSSNATVDINFDDPKSFIFKLNDGKPIAIPLQHSNYKHPILTDEELVAIKACDIDLSKEHIPFDDDLVRDKLLNNPINVNAVQQNGVPYFPHKDALIEFMQQYQINYVEIKEKPSVQIPENISDKSKKDNIEEEKSIVDADFEVVDFGDASDDKDVPDTVSFVESEDEVEEVDENNDVELPDFMKKKK